MDRLLRRLGVIILIAIQVYLASPASAGDIYSVVFSEGYFPETNNAADKFGALVIVRRASCIGCPGVELGRFRGSTLSNPYWYYKNAKGEKTLWKDGSIQPLFEALRIMAEGGALPFRLSELQPILYHFDREWPVLNSGEYSFTVKEQSVLKPRALLVNEGQMVRTLIPNPKYIYSTAMFYAVNGIWIHNGSYTGETRGAEGCLTIHPADWDGFISKFPIESIWKGNHSVGIIWIIRLLGEKQEPPNPISVAPPQPGPPALQ